MKHMGWACGLAQSGSWLLVLCRAQGSNCKMGKKTTLISILESDAKTWNEKNLIM